MKKHNKKLLFLTLLISFSFFLSYNISPTSANKGIGNPIIAKQSNISLNEHSIQNEILLKKASSSSKYSSGSKSSRPKATKPNNSSYGSSNKFTKPNDSSTAPPNNKGSSSNNSNYKSTDKFNSSQNNNGTQSNNSNEAQPNSSSGNYNKSKSYNNSRGFSFMDMYFISSILRSIRRTPVMSILVTIAIIAIIIFIIKKLKNKR